MFEKIKEFFRGNKTNQYPEAEEGERPAGAEVEQPPWTCKGGRVVYPVVCNKCEKRSNLRDKEKAQKPYTCVICRNSKPLKKGEK